MRKGALVWLVVMIMGAGGSPVSADWEAVGTAGFSAGEARTTSAALDGTGTLHVAYSDEADSYRATVTKFDGASWVPVGAAGLSAGMPPSRPSRSTAMTRRTWPSSTRRAPLSPR